MRQPEPPRLAASLASARISDVAADAAALESLGYRGLWVGEGRLRRDAVTALTLAASATSNAYLSSGVVPFRTRNVTVLAITWKSLYQLAPGRVRLGLGAWWEPIASKAGLHTARPLLAMREVVTVLRALFAGDEVTLEGEYTRVNGIRFDGAEDEAGATYNVPLYMAAVGEHMLRLAGEIADGVVLDFLVPPEYTAAAAAIVAQGRRAAPNTTSLDRPQLVACACDDRDPQAAVSAMKVAIARYLAQQTHVADHCGADPDLVKALRKRLTWPATTAELEDAARMIPQDLVRSIAAVGRTSDVIDRLHQYLLAGATEVIVTPFGPRRHEAFELIARKAGLRSGPRE